MPAKKSTETKSASKTNAKGSKTAEKAEKKTEKKSQPRKNLNQTVGYIYGGDVFKAQSCYVFSCDSKDPTEHIKTTLFQYYGPNVSGRFFKVEDAEKSLEAVLKKAGSKKYTIGDDLHLLHVSVENCTKLFKEVTGCSTCNTLKFANGEKADRKTSAKSTKKGGKSKGADKEGTDDGDKEGSKEATKDGTKEEDDEEENQDENDEGEDNQDEEEEDEEEEEKKDTKSKSSKSSKTTAKKTK